MSRIPRSAVPEAAHAGFGPGLFDDDLPLSEILPPTTAVDAARKSRHMLDGLRKASWEG